MQTTRNENEMKEREKTTNYHRTESSSYSRLKLANVFEQLKWFIQDKFSSVQFVHLHSIVAQRLSSLEISYSHCVVFVLSLLLFKFRQKSWNLFLHVFLTYSYDARSKEINLHDSTKDIRERDGTNWSPRGLTDLHLTLAWIILM